jgi:hypothetical protein
LFNVRVYKKSKMFNLFKAFNKFKVTKADEIYMRNQTTLNHKNKKAWNPRPFLYGQCDFAGNDFLPHKPDHETYSTCKAVSTNIFFTYFSALSTNRS